MKCNACSNENKDGAKFCVKCGHRLVDEIIEPVVMEKEAEKTGSLPDLAPPTQDVVINQDKTKSKTAVFIGIAAVFLVCLVFIAIVPGGSAKNSGVKSSITVFHSQDDEESYVLINGQLLDETFDGELDSIQYASDMGSLAFVDEDQTLYYVSADGVVEVAGDIEEYVMSLDGLGIAYLDEDYDLYLFDCIIGKSECIADEIVDEDKDSYYSYSYGYDRQLVISPDGKTVVYNRIDEEDDVVLFLYLNGETIELGKNLIAISSSNDGKCIYAQHEIKEGLYFLSAEGDKKKVATEMSGYGYYLNHDQTEIVYSRSDGSYFTKNGKEKIKMSKGQFAWFITAKEDTSNYRYNNGIYTVTYSWDSFLNRIFSAQDIFYSFNQAGEVEKLIKAKDLADADIIKNKLYYLTKNNLYSLAKTKEAQPEKLQSDVIQFVVSSDGKQIYYIDDDNTLWFQKSNAEPVELMEDVVYLSLDQSDNLYFITDDEMEDYQREENNGVLYSCTDGKEPVQIVDEIQDFNIDRAGVISYYIKIDDADTEYGEDFCDVYISKDGKNFECVLENVRRLTSTLR